MIILAFVVQVPAGGYGGESVGVLCSKTHACGFASMRDTQCGASEESNSGSCWEAEFKRNGETIVVIRKVWWLVLDWVSSFDRRFVVLHSVLFGREEREERRISERFAGSF